MQWHLNGRAAARCRWLSEHRDDLRLAFSSSASGTTLIDCGIEAAGGLEAGRQLAEICLAGLAKVQIVDEPLEAGVGPSVAVRTDHPVAACMASQYAGWQVSLGDYFAMGSGPMRAARGKENLFDEIGLRESPSEAVGVLESSQPPPAEVCAELARECGVLPEKLTLLVAPTASQAGTIQVVARTVETCLHKLHELGFDLAKVASGWGIAPLPPVAPDDLTGIGWTNDAVLYGGRVTLWVHGDDDELIALGSQAPSCASADFGRPFLETFESYQRNFYKIDPLLFSPAQVTLVNLDTGRVHRFGELRHDLLKQSFGVA